MTLTAFDNDCIKTAIGLAKDAESRGNLPVGVIIALEGKMIASGQSVIWVPTYNQNRHAEIEALRSVPQQYWHLAKEMTLYTTLEPCLMCLGAILLHRIGRVVYGSQDGYAGAGSLAAHLPTLFQERMAETIWVGPAYPESCDPLYARLRAIERHRNE